MVNLKSLLSSIALTMMTPTKNPNRKRFYLGSASVEAHTMQTLSGKVRLRGWILLMSTMMTMRFPILTACHRVDLSGQIKMDKSISRPFVPA